MELKCIPEANKQYYLDNIFFFYLLNQESIPLVLRRDFHLWVKVHLSFTEKWVSDVIG